MRPFTVYVPENKITFFKELLNNLHFKVKEEENTIFELTDAYKAILDQRLANYQNDPDSYLDWEDVQKDIEKIL
jgi:putative addiction module component (TIGR02574 family)